jgi:methyl-accepting chemotaxis protein
MAESGTDRFKWILGLLAVLVVLQAAALTLVLRFGIDSARREHAVLNNTDMVLNRSLPAIKNDISEVSGNTTRILGGVIDIKRQVAQVDRHVGDVGAKVSEVGSAVNRVDGSLTEYINGSGSLRDLRLSWYVVVALLLAALAGLGWYIGVERRRRSLSVDTVPQTLTGVPGMFSEVSRKLDDLSVRIDEIRALHDPSLSQPRELRQLMDETEQFIRETRDELNRLSREGSRSVDKASEDSDPLM